MSINLRELVESDLAITLEGEWGLPVELTAPDGTTQTVNGRVDTDSIKLNPETGEAVIVDEPKVTLRRSSLMQVPEAGQYWHIKMPIAPNRLATKYDFLLAPDRAPEGGRSIGYIKLYLVKAEQA